MVLGILCSLFLICFLTKCKNGPYCGSQRGPGFKPARGGSSVCKCQTVVLATFFFLLPRQPLHINRIPTLAVALAWGGRCGPFEVTPPPPPPTPIYESRGTGLGSDPTAPACMDVPKQKYSHWCIHNLLLFSHGPPTPLKKEINMICPCVRQIHSHNQWPALIKGEEEAPRVHLALC